MSSAKIIIIDFDGTLADTSSLIRKIYHEMALEHGWPAMDETEYQRLRGLGFSQAQKWVGIKSWQIPGLMRDGLRRFRQHSTEIELFDGMPQLIKELSKSGSILYILSTNSPETIIEVLNRYDIGTLVTVLKRSALFSKHYAIKHLMSKQKYNPADVWMVGDEVRDIEAAHRAGVKGAAVSWGLQNSNVLKAVVPDVLADNPTQLLKALQG